MSVGISESYRVGKSFYFKKTLQVLGSRSISEIHLKRTNIKYTTLIPLILLLRATKKEKLI